MAGFKKPKTSERALEQRVRKARHILGFSITGVSTKEEILATYNKIVKGSHPDHPDFLKTQLPNWTLNDIRKAKDFLIKQLDNENG